MKKFTTKALIAGLLVAIASIFAPSASAQSKGEMTLGIAAGYASHNDGGYADIYFQYTVAPHVRLAPELGYVFRNKGVSAVEISLDAQFPFRIAKGINVYPLAGVTMNSWNPEHYDTYTRVGMDVGAGFDFYLTSNFKLNLQGKCSLMNDCTGGFFNLGFGYVF